MGGKQKHHVLYTDMKSKPYASSVRYCITLIFKASQFVQMLHADYQTGSYRP